MLVSQGLWRRCAGVPLAGMAGTASAVVAGTALAVVAGTALAAKLPLTGGVAGIDGAGGGALTPWAVTAGRASDGQLGATLSASALRTRDTTLTVQGATLSLGERAELSLARQDLALGDTLAPLGLRGLHLRQRIVAAKLRLAGDAVLDTDTPWPQLALGVLHKRADAGALAPTLHGLLGARPGGTEFTLSATKLWLEPGLLFNATLRSTRANQGGLLGFGAAGGGARRWWPELSLAWLPAPRLALGLEWRRKPDALARSPLGDGALAEDDWSDLFVAWTPVPGLSLTAAWVDLGRIAPGWQPRRQRGAYASLQWLF